MSRSYKRTSTSKQKNSSYHKRLVHTKNRMRERDGVYLSSKQYRHVVNQWDICDWSYAYYSYPLHVEWPRMYYRRDDTDWLAWKQEQYRKGLRK